MIQIDVWRHPVQFLMVIIGVFLALKIKAPVVLKLLAIYVVAQTLYIGFDPNYTSPLIPMVSDYVRLGALHAVIMFALYSSLILFFPKWLNEKYVTPFFVVVFLIDQIWLYVARIIDDPYCLYKGIM